MWVCIHSFAPLLVNCSDICYNIVQGSLDHLDIPWNITLVCYIANITLFEPNEQEVASIPDALVKPMFSRG